MFYSNFHSPASLKRDFSRNRSTAALHCWAYLEHAWILSACWTKKRLKSKRPRSKGRSRKGPQWVSRDQRIKEQEPGRGVGHQEGLRGRGKSCAEHRWKEAGGKQLRTGGERQGAWVPMLVAKAKCQPGLPQGTSKGPTQRPPPIFSFVLPFRFPIFYQNTCFTYFSYLLCLVGLTPLEGKSHEGRNHVSLFIDGSLVTRAVFDKWETLRKYNHEMLK